MTPPSIDLAYGEARDAIAELRRNLAIVTQERDALRQENESLRAQCGLRQIQGYHEGKQRAEADNAALLALLAKVDLRKVDDDDLVRKILALRR